MKQSQVELKLKQSLRARYAHERRFRVTGGVAIVVGVLFLVWLLGVNIYQASSAFSQTYVQLDLELERGLFVSEEQDLTANARVGQGAGEGEGGGIITAESIHGARYGRIIKNALRAQFPDADTRKKRKQLYGLVSGGAEYAVRDAVLDSPQLIGATRQFWVLADDEVDMFMKGYISRDLPEDSRRLSDQAIAWIDALRAQGRIERKFNALFFTAGDSRDAEQAGILASFMGSVFTLLVTMLLALPVGIAAAVYLQEFAPRRSGFRRFIDLVEVNINNLAAVPSIIFGLLGLAVLINFFGMPRSASMVGGMVLALMTVPTIIISSRAALAAVPPRIRQAALAVGASKVQAVIHHILPLALPGMLTGAIIGLARALGETAPLLAIGMVAFIVDIPTAPTDPAAVLPVQIYLWADSPERAFVERTAAAILVLLAILALINGIIAVLRNKVEKRW